MKSGSCSIFHFHFPDFYKCFLSTELRYATSVERLFVLIGILCAIGAGICVPMLVILFGKMANSFILYGIQNEYNKQLRKNSRLVDKLIGFRWLKNESYRIQTTSNLLQDTLDFATAMVIVGTLELMFGATFVVLLNYAAQVLKTRSAYFKAILYHEMGWFDLQNPRDISRNVIRHVSNLYDGLGEKLGIFIYTTTACVSCIAVAISYGWKLALVILLVLPLVIFISCIKKKIGKCLLMQEIEAYNTAETVAEDAISNIKTVFAYQGEKFEAMKYKISLEPSERAFIRTHSFHGLMGGFLWFTIYCSYALAFYYGISLTMESDNQAYTPTVLIIVFFCVQIGIVSFLHLFGYFKVIMKAKFSANEMFATIDRIPTIHSENAEGNILPDLRGSVAFNNVHFCYPSNTAIKILQGLTFNIKEGQCVVLAGNSGCGKTTCLRLIHRFYDVQYGTVQIDDINIRQLNLHWLRHNIGFVQQKSVLFGVTIAESICHGLSGVSQADVINVAKIVYAHSFIMKLPKQYNSPLNNDLGEDIRQRLAIAQVLLHKPCMLMLDNAMSHLTTKEEVKLIESIIKFHGEKTVIIVTSRIPTMKIVDKLFHIKNGIVIEEGTFSVLMTSKREFYNLVRRSTTLNSNGSDEDSILEFEPIPCDKLIQMCNLSSYNRTLPNDRITSVEYIHPDTVHISHISVPHNLGERPILTCVQEKELHKFSWIKILKLNSNEWLPLFIACVAAMIIGFSLPAYAVLFGECLGVIARKPTQEFQMKLNFYTELFIVAGFISGSAMIVQGYMIAVSDSKLIKRLRMASFDAILKQEIAWFDDEANDLDSLLHLLRVDAVNTRFASGERLTALTQAMCVAILTTTLAIYYNWKFGLSVALFVPMMLLGFIYQNHIVFQHSLYEGSKLLQTKMIVDEAVTNIKVVASLSLQNYFLMQFTVPLINKRPLRRLLLKRGLIYGVILAFPYYAYASCMFFGAYLLQNREIGYENVFKVSESMVLGTIMISQLVIFGPSMVNAKLSATKIMHILKRKPLIYSPTSGFKRKWETNGNIIFHHVEFLHPNTPCLPKLKDFNLQIKEGQVVALVGSIGSGQSVPIQLLMRYYEPTEGKVLLDERDIAAINIGTLRGQIGLADGNPVFFHCSVAENIAYGCTSQEIKMDEVLCAAKEANVHNYVVSLPQGYATVLNGEELKMTFGQKFRLSLARALLRDPLILLIENLQMAEDEDAEILVEETVKQCCLGRTCIIASHSLISAIHNADNICVLHKGIVVEEGTHRGLLEAHGLYYRMYCAQEQLKRKITNSDFEECDFNSENKSFHNNME